MVLKRLSALGLAVLAGSLVLAGCTSDDSDAAAQTIMPSASVSVSATPTPTAPPPPATPYRFPTPEEPEGMYQHTDGGAIATAQYFVELIGYQASTGDTSKMEKISLPECEYCNGRIAYVKHTYSIGSWADNFHTTNMTLLGYGPAPEGELGEIGVRIDVITPTYQYYIPDEGGLGIEESLELNMAVILEWHEDRWMVLGASGRDPNKGPKK